MGNISNISIYFINFGTVNPRTLITDLPFIIIIKNNSLCSPLFNGCNKHTTLFIGINNGTNARFRNSVTKMIIICHN